MNVLVTVTFNALKDGVLDDFLASVDAQDSDDFLLLFVDNASGDGTVEYLRGLDRPYVRVLLNDENVGFGAACNQGIALAKELEADHVTFINNDTSFGPGLIGGMVASLAETGADALVPLITYHSQPDRVWFVTGSFRLSRGIMPYHDHIGCRRTDVPMRPIEPTAFASGCCIICRMDALDAVGGFDERFFVYWEDADLSKALAEKGRRIVVDTRLECRHKVSVSTGGSFSDFSVFHFTRGHILFVRKHHGFAAAMAIIPVSLGKALLNAVRGRMAWKRLASWRRGAMTGLRD